ncbi:MAG: C1 family peptidase [Candidatus Hydrogenedentota bacterium]
MRLFRSRGLIAALALTAALFGAGCPLIFPNIVVVTPPLATVEAGKTVDLDAESTQVDENYTWSSGDTAIATVDAKGVVTGVAPGVASIRATGDESGDRGEALVTVVAAEESFDTPTVQSRETVIGDDGLPGTVVTLANGDQFKLDDPDYVAEYAERSPDRSGKAMDLKEFAEESVRMKQRPSQQRISLSGDQTSVKNQLDRGTCVSHATLAALEAAYNRQGSSNLNLSEQYFQHVSKSRWLHDFANDDDGTHTRDGWENQLSMGGGGNIYSALSFLMDYRVCEEQFAPYEHTNKAGHSWGDYGNANQGGDDPRVDWRDRSGGETQAEVSDYNMVQDRITIQVPNNYNVTPLPQDAIDNALYGITGYETVPGNRVDDPVWYEQQIAAGREVLIALNFVSDTEDDILYPRDQEDDEGGAWHALLIVGYDRTDSDEPYFIVKNSWGGNSFIKLSYDWLDSGLDGRITQAAYITGVVTPDPDSLPAQIYMGRWLLVYDGEVGTLDIHRNSQFFAANKLGGIEDYRLGAFYDSSGNLYRVNGTIDENGRMEAYIDFTTPNLDYETRSGLRFTADIDRGNTKLMAGTYERADGTLGTKAFYATKQGTYNANSVATTLDDDTFLGEWRIESPVIEGSLEVRAVNGANAEFGGRYNHSGGWISTDGTADSGTQEVSFNLPTADGGHFDGYIHAGSLGIISGTYTENGDATGMVLVREGAATETIEITAPDNGEVFSMGGTVALESVVEVDGTEEPDALVIWTEDGPYDPADSTAHRILSQSGPNGSTKLPAGTFDIYATYIGREVLSDSVTITVQGPSDPTVQITSPDDDSYHQDLTTPPNVTVDFSGSATAADGTALSGSDLQWSYRPEGESAWTGSSETGENATLSLRDRNCRGTTYDIRLQATDADGDTGTAIIRITINGFFC